jgi:trimethylamine:corrinoid methyltransferase-like protein
MNSEYYYPHTGDRQRRADWEMAGGRDMWEQAREKAEAILRDHKPLSISGQIDDAIRQRFEILLTKELANQRSSQA